MNLNTIFDFNNKISASPTSELDLYACRVCLATDIKLFDIHECDLADLFQLVMGFAIPPDDGLPQHLCHYCFALMQKYGSFKEKCSRSQEVLHTSLMLKQLITTEYIRLIDREAEQLTYPYEVHSTSFIDYDIIENEESDTDAYSLKDDEETYILEAVEDAIKKEYIEVEEKKTGHNHINKDHQIINKVHDEDKEFVFPHKVADHPNIDLLKLSMEQQINNMLERKSSKSYKIAPFKCNHCYKGFYKSSAYDGHMKLHDISSGEYLCSLCYLRFPVEAKLKWHVTSVHERRFRCRLCSHVDAEGQKALEHQLFHMNVQYDCKHCGLTFDTSKECFKHTNSCPVSSIVCPECGRAFRSEKSLKLHSKIHKVKTPSWIHCEECDSEFDGVDAFNRHIETSSRHTAVGQNLFHHCKRCGESFAEEKELLDHEITHEYVSMSTVDCVECNIAFTSVKELKTHRKKEHGDVCGSEWVCEVCGKIFKSDLKLAQHCRLHLLEEAQHVCPFCSKKFKMAQYLQTHIRVHTGERPYQCKICSMAFQAKANLNRHYKVHTGEKPYICAECGKGFTQSNSMKLHVRSVHLQQPDPYRHRRPLYRRRRRQDGPYGSESRPERPLPTL